MPTQTNSTKGARMAGKKEWPPFVASKVPVTEIQLADSSVKKIPAINSAPKVSPKPKSNHQHPSIRNPNLENGRRSMRRPASHTLKSAAANDITPVTGTNEGDEGTVSMIPLPRPSPPKSKNATYAVLVKTVALIRVIVNWSSNRQKARSRPSRAL